MADESRPLTLSDFGTGFALGIIVGIMFCVVVLILSPG